MLPATLRSVLAQLENLANEVNATQINAFYEWMRDNQKSESYQKNNVKAITNFATWLYREDPAAALFGVDTRETVLRFLDTKMKTREDDPDGRWITTWNDYLDRIKVFYRWLYNYQAVDAKKRLPPEEWTTPEFVKIKHRKPQRVSPYTASEIWDLDDLLAVIKYEPNPRNKAAIMLLWDLGSKVQRLEEIWLSLTYYNFSWQETKLIQNIGQGLLK